MIERLTLRRFQCYERFSLDLDPGVNVIMGRSGRGKSALLRALYWVCTNRPGGAFFIRNGADSTAVSVCVDGHKVSRKRGKGNTYSLDGEVYKSFGAGVPEAIGSLLNVGDVNFATQYDSPWWFMLSPGEVSKGLNEIVDLSLIDSTLANLASDLRRARTEAELGKGRLEKARGERDKLNWVTQADNKLREIEADEKKARDVKRRASELDTLIQDAEAKREVLKEGSRRLRAGEEVLTKAQAAEASITSLRTLDRLITEGQRWQRELDRTEKEIGNTSRKLGKLMAKGCPLCGRALRGTP